MNPFRVEDGASISPVAADHVAAIDLAGKAARHAVACNGDIDAVLEDIRNPLVVEVDRHGGAFHIVDHRAPAR